MTWIPPVRARLAQRLIFNFRLPPEAMATLLPKQWLIPQIVNGFGVASFCMLDLRGITIAPLPTNFGVGSISCAPRFAVKDVSTSIAKQAVFVTDRWTSSKFGSWFTSLGFSAPHPYARAEWIEKEGAIDVEISSPHKGSVVTTKVRRALDFQSELFKSATDFAAFIAQGVSSYGRSRYANRLTKVDLHKCDNTYSPLVVEQLDGPDIQKWLSLGGVLDSAFYTSGGRYEWIYHGLAD